MNDFRVNINLVVALMVEAKPFIDKLKLSHDAKHSTFKIYTSDNGNINLIVSGIGRNNAAAATAYLGAITSAQHDAAFWINAGIAGHSSLPVGDVVIANKLLERSTGRTFYPSVYPVSFTSTLLTTVDQPETSYLEQSAFDMEASAFAAAASKFSPLEFIQCVKVISDNIESGVESVSKGSIEQAAQTLVAAVNELIEAMGPDLEHCLAQTYLPKVFDDLRSGTHFSATQTVQLKRLCQRFSALGLEAKLNEMALLTFTSSKECIRLLEAELLLPEIGIKEH